ncbi:MAG: tRNA uridine-5-carboxymethylaminomethyl(34) synthesis enzyme MnmG [Clostridiaceae bacterium]|nr:tRNA uridine-5-carboxymethylaminomethyl(34) synthesis enzyme MnmG [Clostridiaceae bacterium]
MRFNAGQYDIAVIGAGHAGCEAALAGARLGFKTIVFAINLDTIANLPCNPNIGGTAKGHLVREIDALGGEIGKAADATFVQSRMLNKGKGPAVYSLRVQTDKRRYQEYMKRVLEEQSNLDIKQAEVVEILTDNGKVTGVVTHTGAVYNANAVIIATGTFLRGKIIVGDVSYEGGPDGLFAATKLSGSLSKIGVSLRRFKTGTPPRVNANSIDHSKLELQKGDDEIIPFSFETTQLGENKEVCYITYTNENTHRVIRENLHRSPLFGGQIKGIGPRYCPSIEDKVVRFADKDRHQVFVEPMGEGTNERYIQGMSSSLPEDVQIQMIRTMAGFENAHIMRTAYAIEYDCIPTSQLKYSLEFKNISGLYGAGQFNGTSGYEEAAAQGLIAGINAARALCGKPPVVLSRSEAYIGVLIDDIITKDITEPYRMLTSRAEHRLLLRQDNADIRLTPLGYEIGLISEQRYQRFCEMKQTIEKEIARLNAKTVPPTPLVNNFLQKHSSTCINTGIKLSELLRRPEITYISLAEIDDEFPNIEKSIAYQVEITVKYEGYIKRQQRRAQSEQRLDSMRIPSGIDYLSINGIRTEARQKLDKAKPDTIGQASRIAGVSPADISVLLVYLKRNKTASD